MDTGSLVESRIEEGRYLLEKLAASGFDVSAAAWVKTSDDETWRLYVVSRTVEELGLAQAYGASSAVRRQIPEPWASTLDLKLDWPDTPFGRRLLEIQNRFGGRIPVPMPLQRVGDVMALELYLYPRVVPSAQGEQPLTPGEVVQKVVGLMGRTDPVKPSRVTLRDGTTFLGVPFGVERSGDSMQVKFAVDGFAPPRIYPAETIRTLE